jgi:hypothetical protein
LDKLSAEIIFRSYIQPKVAKLPELDTKDEVQSALIAALSKNSSNLSIPASNIAKPNCSLENTEFFGKRTNLRSFAVFVDSVKWRN